MRDNRELAAPLPGNQIKLCSQSMYLFLIPSNQRGLVHNLIALCFDLDLLSSCRKLQGVVCLFSLAGGWCDGTDDRNAGTIPSQRALQT